MKVYIQQLISPSSLTVLTIFSFVLALASLTPDSLYAQIRQLPQKSEIDLSNYATPHDCMAAYNRIVRDSLINAERADTIEFDPTDPVLAPPRYAVYTLRACIERLSPEIRRDEASEVWIMALTRAHLFDRAVTLAMTQLEDVPKDSLAVKELKIIADLLKAASNVIPIPIEQLGPLESRVNTLIRDMSDSVKSDWETRFFVIRNYDARNRGDTLAAIESAMRTLSDEKQLERYSKSALGTNAVYKYLLLVNMEEVKDSLRRGTDAYVSLSESFWNKARRSGNLAFPYPLGEKATPIVGDFIYSHLNPDTSHASGALVRPEAGRPNLILFIKGCRPDKPFTLTENFRPTGNNNYCFDLFASVKRLKKRFPDLSITFVTQTIGFFGHSDPLEPKVEADLLRDWLIKYHSLPISLFVTEGKYFRLPTYDDRVIDEIDENRENYTFSGRLGEMINPDIYAFLLDHESRLLSLDALSKKYELEIRRMLEVMTETVSE